MRKLTLALVALGLAFGLTASPAYAAGGEPGKCFAEEAQANELDLLTIDLEKTDGELSEAAEEQVAEAEEIFESCEVIANPILPAINELIWGGLAFTVLAIVAIKFAVPPVKQAMSDRTEKIREEVEAAERIRQEASAEESAREDELKEARKEAAAHVEAARKEADEYRTAERAKIDAELAELREQGQADAEASKQQALSELRGEVATLAIGAAEQVVGQNLDRAANERIVENFIDSVGSGNRDSLSGNGAG